MQEWKWDAVIFKLEGDENKVEKKRKFWLHIHASASEYMREDKKITL